MTTQPKTLDVKKGLNDQTRINPAIFTADINEDDEVRNIKPAKAKVKPDQKDFVQPEEAKAKNALSPEEAKAEDAEARADLVGEYQKKKRSKLSKLFRPKMSDAEYTKKVAARKTRKTNKQVERQKKFAKNQPRLKSMGKILAPPSSDGSTQGTSGTRYSPEGGATDRAFQNIINTLTMRRSSGG